MMSRKIFAALLLATILTLPALAQTTETNWTPAGQIPGITDFTTRYLYVDSALMVACYFGPCYRSVDQGKTWSRITRISKEINMVAGINGKYIATTGTGVYRSTDLGESWIKITAGFEKYGTDIDMKWVVVQGTAVYVGAAAFPPKPHVYRSTDEGLAWAPTSTVDDTFGEAQSFAIIGNTIVLTTGAGKLYRSTNGGGTWAETKTGYEESGNPSVVANSTSFFVAQRKGVFRSDDLGQTWTLLLGFPVSVYAAGIANSTIAVKGKTLIVNANDSAAFPSRDLFVSTDNGATWTPTKAHKATDNSFLSSLYPVTFANGKAYMMGYHGRLYVNTAILPQPTVATVSAASFKHGSLTAESIAAVFGEDLATAVRKATTTPLPTDLGGTKVKVKDGAGTERYAPLFFVSPTQANFQIPPGTAAGAGTVTVELNGAKAADGSITIAAVSPGLFTANANGQGYPAAVVLRVRGAAQTVEPVVTYDAAQQRFVASPIDLGPDTDQLFLILFGTGVRGRTALSSVTATINGLAAGVTFAGAQGALVGLDQVNLRLPRSLKGINRDADVVLTVNGVAANTVRVNIK